MKKVVVVGGGASGMFASILLARQGFEVTVIEKNEKLGKKLFITGKGRCNLTNDADIDTMRANIVNGEKFLLSSLYKWTPQNTIAYFEELGLQVVVERGNRVFPLSQKSYDVIDRLKMEMSRLRVKVKLMETVLSVDKVDAETSADCENAEDKNCTNCASEHRFNIITDMGQYKCDYVLVATGGKSYPSTGSTGDGLKFAEKFGLKIKDSIPALVEMYVGDNVAPLEGISLKNVCLSAFSNDKLIRSDFGEMLFTKRGLSGPIALSISSYVNRLQNVRLVLDLKPALDDKTLDNRLIREFSDRSNQDIKNVSRSLMPDRLNSFVLAKSQISPSKKVNVITKEERQKLVSTIKNLTFKLTGFAGFESAIITSGGVATASLKPSMQARGVDGLYFVGEVVDIDALTGGFNLQLAFATAYRAVEDICAD